MFNSDDVIGCFLHAGNCRFCKNKLEYVSFLDGKELGFVFKCGKCKTILIAKLEYFMEEGSVALCMNKGDVRKWI